MESIAAQVPVVEGELVTIDQSLTPYIEDQHQLEVMARRLTTFADTAAVLRVNSPDEKRAAARHVSQWKGDRKVVLDFFKPIKQNIDRVKEIALKMERTILGYVDGPVAVVTGAITSYDRIVAAEAEERRQAILQAELRRLQDEAEAAALIDAHIHACTPVISARAADVIKAVEIAAAEAPEAPAVVEGFYYVTTPHFAVDDLQALVAAVAAGTVPLDVLCADERVIRQRVANAASAGGKDDEISARLGYPGVRVWTTQDPRSRAS